jgi:hypothetical protein
MGRFSKLATNSWKAVLQTIAVYLLTTGANQINSGDYLTGGVLVIIGFALFLVANYT